MFYYAQLYRYSLCDEEQKDDIVFQYYKKLKHIPDTKKLDAS